MILLILVFLIYPSLNFSQVYNVDNEEDISNYEININLQKQVIDENIVFEKYLSNQWEQNLKDSPIFASLLGNKSFNQEITSNSIEEFFKNKAKSLSIAELNGVPERLIISPVV